MDHPLWASCGFDENTIADRLRLIELDQEGMEASGRILHDHIIVPNVDAIVDRFYGSLLRIDDFNRIVDGSSTAARLRESQKHYLLGLGIDFHKREYFEERLRIGSVHQRIGVPQSLYQCTFQGLQSLLIEYIPDAIRNDAAGLRGGAPVYPQDHGARYVAGRRKLLFGQSIRPYDVTRERAR